MALEDDLLKIKNTIELFREKMILKRKENDAIFLTEPGKVFIQKYSDFIEFWGRMVSKNNINGWKMLLETIFSDDSNIAEYNDFNDILTKLGIKIEDVDMLISISIVYYNSIIEDYFKSIKSAIFRKLIEENKIEEAEEFLSGYSKLSFGGIVDYFLKYTIKKEVIIEHLGKEIYSLLKNEFTDFRKKRNKFAHEGETHHPEETESMFFYLMKNIQNQLHDKDKLKSKIRQIIYRSNEEKILVSNLSLMLFYYPLFLVSVLDVSIFHWMERIIE